MARTTPLLAWPLLLTFACTETAAPPAPARDERPPGETAAGTGAELAAKDVPKAAAAVDSPVARPAAPAAKPLLVWGYEDDEGYTWWIQPDGAGGFDVVRRFGTVVAADGALWQWAFSEERVATEVDCADPGQIPGEAFGVRAYLYRIDGGERRDVVVANDDAQLVGSIGPYLFVRRSGYSYHCGAHGRIEQHEAFVWDVRSRQRVAVYTPDALASMLAEARERLALESDGELGGEVTRTMVRPVFDPTGAVRMEHQWTAGTVSTRLVIDALPQTLAPHVPDGAGAAIRHLHESVEGLVVDGVGEAYPAWRGRFEALPAEVECDR